MDTTYHTFLYHRLGWEMLLGVPIVVSEENVGTTKSSKDNHEKINQRVSANFEKIMRSKNMHAYFEMIAADKHGVTLWKDMPSDVIRARDHTSQDFGIDAASPTISGGKAIQVKYYMSRTPKLTKTAMATFFYAAKGFDNPYDEICLVVNNRSLVPKHGMRMIQFDVIDRRYIRAYCYEAAKNYYSLPNFVMEERNALYLKLNDRGLPTKTIRMVDTKKKKVRVKRKKIVPPVSCMTVVAKAYTILLGNEKHSFNTKKALIILLDGIPPNECKECISNGVRKFSVADRGTTFKTRPAFHICTLDGLSQIEGYAKAGGKNGYLYIGVLARKIIDRDLLERIQKIPHVTWDTCVV